MNINSNSLIFLLNLAGIYGYSYHLNGVETGFSYLTRIIKENKNISLEAVQEKWITQPVDHFDKNEKRFWQMRYFHNFDYFQPYGPIYIFIGGEAELEPGFIADGPLVELAQETNGVLFATEHRYYGKSLPLTPVNNINNLKYLSSNQALADLASFITALKMMPDFANSKVVVVGGSYPGNLAAWMRQKFPKLVDAAISSSAPVLAKVNFPEYFEKVGDDFRKYGTDSCLVPITKYFSDIDRLLKTAEGKRQLQICEEVDMTNPINKGAYFSPRFGIFASEAQYGDPASIAQFCNNYRSSAAADEFGGCRDPFQEMVMAYKNVEWIPWLYQTCTEFGYFMTNPYRRIPFFGEVPVELDVALCYKIFGPQFTLQNIQRNVDNINNQHGGLRPNVTKVVFVNGDMDPWSTLGITKSLSDSAPAIVIPAASHCKDLRPRADNDSQELIMAREQSKKLIKKWIG